MQCSDRQLVRPWIGHSIQVVHGRHTLQPTQPAQHVDLHSVGKPAQHMQMVVEASQVDSREQHIELLLHVIVITLLGPCVSQVYV